MTGEKVWWKSSGVWGAIITLASAVGGLSLAFDPATGDLTVNVYQVGGALLTVGTPVGGLLSIFGRLRAGSKIAKRIL